MKYLRRPRHRPTMVAAVALVIALAACSNPGPKPVAPSTTGDTPHRTVALVTHQAPGDTFWDLVRKGAEAAAAKDNIDLQYAHDPDAAGQAKDRKSVV